MKYTLTKKGYGKYQYYVPKNISEAKAKHLKSSGEKVYSSYEEAKEDCEKK